MFRSFVTTVVTPPKCPGRESPSYRRVRRCTETAVSKSGRYISWARGRKTASTPPDRQRRRSCTSERGYRSKSSSGPNCRGFTKMLTATASQASLAARISKRCPSCSAPMVGTSPIVTPSRWSLRDQVRSEEHTSELQSRLHLVCRLLLEKKKKKIENKNKVEQ